MKAEKGNFGYLKKKRTRVLLWTLLCFGVSLALFFTGIITTGTRKNLLTIVAVLGLLPASKSAVSLVLLFLAKGCSEEDRDRIEKIPQTFLSLYDMYFTSYEKNFSLSHMIVTDGIVLGYAADPKCDTKACAGHITDRLKMSGIKKVTVTITEDLSKYLSMTETLSKKLEGKTEENKTEEGEAESGREDEIRDVLFEISL
ncbi:MAG: hypothetical protein K6F53_00745 [Lachnospiraceae bacterium]|nr:hypothetical protein [Lachnospiraceae bacterium]